VSGLIISGIAARELREHYTREENKIKERLDYLEAFIAKKLG